MNQMGKLDFLTDMQFKNSPVRHVFVNNLANCITKFDALSRQKAADTENVTQY